MKICKGFTLIELLTALAVISITLSFSMTGFNGIKKLRYDAASRDVLGAIQFARNRSINLNQSTFLCPSSVNTECEKGWAKKLLIYQDLDGDKLLSDESELIRTIDFESINAHIKWRSFRRKPYLEISALGTTNYLNGTFTLCPLDKQLERAKTIIVNAAGRPYFGQDRNKNGIAEYSGGKDVTCE